MEATKPTGLAEFMASLTDAQLEYFESHMDSSDVAAIAAAIRAVKPLFAPPEKPKRGRPRKSKESANAQ